MVFFGIDEMGNTIMFGINQINHLKKSNSVFLIRDHTGLEYTNKGILIFKTNYEYNINFLYNGYGSL